MGSRKKKRHQAGGPPLSRSALKRRAHAVEDLARELAGLHAASLSGLPLDDEVRREVEVAAAAPRDSSRKRQVKYLAKLLRDRDIDPILQALEQKRGSRLREKHRFAELERQRNLLVDQAMAAHEQAMKEGAVLSASWRPEVIDADLTDDEADAVVSALHSFARSRKKKYFRQVFRVLEAADERRQREKKINMLLEKGG